MREAVSTDGTRIDHEGMRKRAERVISGNGRAGGEEIVDSTSREIDGLIADVEERQKGAKAEVDATGERLDALAAGSTAYAIARESKGEKALQSARVVEGFVMPELETLVGESEAVKELKPEEQLEVYEEARDLNFTDALKTMGFGLEEQKKASEITRDFIEEVRNTDLESLTAIASENNQRMEQLNIGELQPGFWQKMLRGILPHKKAEAVRAFLDKHKSLSELVNDGEVAMADERVKLETHHARMVKKIAENTETYNQLGKRTGAAELSYAASKRWVEEVKQQYEVTPNASKAREIALLDQALTRQARRINSLKASRQETLQALRTMDMQLQGIESQISMIDEAAAFNRLVWDNSVLMVATDRRMKNSVEAVEFNRQQVEKMIRTRGGNIAETLRHILKEQGEGVVNAAVLEFAAKQLLDMNKTIIKGNNDIRTKMKEADQVIERMDRLVKDAASHAALMTKEDEAALDNFLDKAGVAKGGGGASGGSVNPPEPEQPKKKKK